QGAVKVQAGTGKKIERLVKGSAASRLRKRPAPDKWSVVEIVAHLADTEIGVACRGRSLRRAPGQPTPSFSQDAWVAGGRYASRDPRKCLEQFRPLREANLALLKSLTPE